MTSQEKLKTVLMQNFWGQTRYIMGRVQMVHSVAPPPPPLLYTLLFLNSPGTGPMYYLGEKTVYREEMENRE